MKIHFTIAFSAILVLISSCNKKGCTDETANNYSSEAKKDDGSCTYTTLDIPSTYSFTDEAGNSTVNYSGQVDRLNQLEEFMTYLKSGNSTILDGSIINDMFANTNGDGNGNFSFTSTKQLKDKCFASDVALYESYFALIASASENFATPASSGQAGTLTSGSSVYLVDTNGMEYAQIIEKGLMGAIFMNQATDVYFGDSKMNVDNSIAVDPANGKYYTEMEHHWDEAFGYFGASIDFPSNLSELRFWSKYCDQQDAALGCNSIMMNAFLKGRAAISQKADLDIRNDEILLIRKTWERIIASQAVTYLESAKTHFGVDNAKFMHALSETYGFILCLKYVPLDTRVITYPQIETLLTTTIGADFWAVSLADLNVAIANLNDIYGF